MAVAVSQQTGLHGVLGTLPLRAGEIFFAKLIALVLLVSALIVTLNALPVIAFPAVSMSRWQVNPSFWRHVEAHAATCTLAAYFFFFSIVALQGVLLNIFRPAWLARTANYVQGALIILMLVLIVMSFSIGPSVERYLLRPEVSKWLPPVWFVGLYQTMLQDPDPLFHQLAGKALCGLGAATVVALISYVIGYTRYRDLALETANSPQRAGSMAASLLDWLIPNPRRKGALAFMMKTLARSGRHRMVLMGYFGIALAVLLSGLAGTSAVADTGRALVADFAYIHMALLLFLLLGLRHSFNVPMELPANWVFQVAESEGRAEWLRARLTTWPSFPLFSSSWRFRLPWKSHFSAGAGYARQPCSRPPTYYFTNFYSASGASSPLRARTFRVEFMSS